MIALIYNTTLVFYIGTNYLTNRVNLLNKIKKIQKQGTLARALTNIVSLSSITRKNKNNVEQSITKMNQQEKSYCLQKGLGFREWSLLTVGTWVKRI